MTKHQPFLGWPGWAVLGEGIALGLLQTAWWVFVYHGCNWINSQRERGRVHFDAELAMPFVPAALLLYRSIDVMFPLAYFVLRTRAEVRGIILTLAIVTGVGGLGFLLFPAQLAYPPQDAGAWTDFYEFNKRIVLHYNLLPSLHVGLSVVILAAFARRRGPLGKALLALWATGIAASTLLLHLHHVIDVPAGALLGWAGYRLVYLPFVRRAEGAPDARPSPPDPVPPA